MITIGLVFFAAAYACILLLPYLRGKAAANSRESPGRVAPPLAAIELRKRFQQISVEHPEIDVDTAGELIHVTWNLDEAARHAVVSEPSADPTYALELQIVEGDAVNVRVAVGDLDWQVGTDDSAPLKPTIRWEWPLESVSGPEKSAEPWVPAAIGSESKRNLRHLVEFARQVTLGAGYSWQPVLEMTPGAGQTSNRTEVETTSFGARV
jgi:hypothetical protein